MSSKLRLTILDPEGTRISEIPVEEVIVPAFNGKLGIRSGHAPFMAVLKEGEIRYSADLKSGKYETIGIYRGFAEVLNNSVIILAANKDFAEKIRFEANKQEERKKNRAGRVQGDEINLDEASALINRSLEVLKNLKRNARNVRK